MSNSDDDFLSTGYDPSDVIGYDEQQNYADISDAVPDVTSDLYTEDRRGDLADLMEDELDAVAQGFRDRRDKEAERYELATNSDYWFCVCFATHEQREAFIAATGWRDLGHRYIDGRLLAQRLDITLPADPEWPNSKRDTTWDQFAMSVEDNRSIDL